MAGERIRVLFDEIATRFTEARTELDKLAPPAPVAKVLKVKPGDDVAAAILSLANTGGTVALAPGAVYRMNLRWPERTPQSPPVDVVTDTSDVYSARMDKKYAAGLAILMSANGLDPVVKMLPRSHDLNFRVIGFGPQTPDRTVVDLGGDRVELSNQTDRAHGFVFDRCLFQGDPVKGQHRGIQANAFNVAVLSCAFYDFFEVGRDSQAICGWNGTEALNIYDCYIEGGAENVMIGGACSASVEMSPRNVRITGSHFAKQKAWSKLAAAPSIKALLEIKNVRGLYVSGCLFEQNWARDWASGVGVILKSCNGDDNGLETWASLEDVVIEDCVIRRVGSPFTIVGQNDSLRTSMRGARVTIRNVLAYDINTGDWLGTGDGFPMFNPPDDLTVDHITTIGNNHTFMNTEIVNGATAKGKRFAFTNSIGYHGEYGVHSSGGLGAKAIDVGFESPYSFTGNVLRKHPDRTVVLPPGNAVIDQPAFDGSFISFMGGMSVKPASAIANAVTTTDGKLPGADVMKILSVMRDPL